MRILILSITAILIWVSCNKSEETLIGEYLSDATGFYELPLFIFPDLTDTQAVPH